MQSSRWLSWWSSLATLSALSACGEFSAGSTTSDLGGFGGGGGQVNTSSGGAGGTGGGGPQKFTYEAYCGIADCVPGDLEACSTGGSTSSSGGSGTGGAGGGYPGGSGGEGGFGGAGVGGGGAGGSATAGVGTGSGGASPGGGDGDDGGSPSPALGCTIVDDDGTPVSACAPVGVKLDGEVCNASSECASGLGCVLAADLGDTNEGGPQAVGQCKPYCCGDLEAGCPDASTFCALRPAFDAAAKQAGETEPLSVPVCVPTKPCTLLGGDCDVGETCTIVRESTGTTSCVPVGDGTTCQPCPCAADHICSYATGTCLKLCDTSLQNCPGTNALCQGGMIASVGVCIGGDAVCE